MRSLIRATASPLGVSAWRVGIASLLGVALALAGCQVTPPVVTPPAGPPHAVFTRVTYAELPGWNDDRVDAAWPAFRVGCKTLVTRARTADVWRSVCDRAATIGKYARDGSGWNGDQRTVGNLPMAIVRT